MFKFARLIPKHGILFANHLSLEVDEEGREIMKEVTAY
jgi:hypothetical protein